MAMREDEYIFNNAIIGKFQASLNAELGRKNRVYLNPPRRRRLPKLAWLSIQDSHI